MIRLTRPEATLLIDLNGQSVSGVSDLRKRLGDIIELGVQPPVIVDPSDEVTMNHAVEVYDAAREAGADRVLFAAQPE